MPLLNARQRLQYNRTSLCQGAKINFVTETDVLISVFVTKPADSTLKQRFM